MPRKARSAEAKIRLLRLAEELKSVSQACCVAGFSRDSFYRFKRLYEIGGARALAAPLRRKSAPRNQISRQIEQAILELARSRPNSGRHLISKILYQRELGISPSGVRFVWLRWGLETARKRKTWALESRKIGKAEKTKSDGPGGVERPKWPK